MSVPRLPTIDALDPYERQMLHPALIKEVFACGASSTSPFIWQSGASHSPEADLQDQYVSRKCTLEWSNCALLVVDTGARDQRKVIINGTSSGAKPYLGHVHLESPVC